MQTIDDLKKIDEDRRKFSFEMTQKLSYFVITLELALCGYLLLYADKLKKLIGADWLFLCSGIAAFIGLTWRYLYNITYDAYAHRREFTFKLKWCARFQWGTYHLYVFLSFASLIWVLIIGFRYLRVVNS